MWIFKRSKKEKRTALNISAIFLTILALPISGCFDSSNSEDKKFLSSVSRKLEKIGDTVKVSDIHSGDWSEVCATPLGAYGDVKKDASQLWGINRNDIVISNKGSLSRTNYDDETWGIFFYYPPNKIEYFRIDWKDAYHIEKNKSGTYLCLGKDRAFLRVVGNAKNRSAVADSVELPDSYLELSLINNKDM